MSAAGQAIADGMDRQMHGEQKPTQDDIKYVHLTSLLLSVNTETAPVLHTHTHSRTGEHRERPHFSSESLVRKESDHNNPNEGSIVPAS